MSKVASISFAHTQAAMTDNTRSTEGRLETRYPSLRDRTVFVTGGATGIGAAIVSAFVAQGARVAFIDVAEEPSRALARQIAAAGQAPPWWRVRDVRDIAALQAAIVEASDELGDFAVLVNTSPATTDTASTR